MSSRQPQFVCLVVLVILFVVTQARAQEKNASYVQLPTEVMDHQLTTISGKKLKLADYPDRIVIMNIFATWVYPALLNLKDLNRLEKHYKKHRIEIIGLASAENEQNVESVREFARINKISFDIVWESGDFATSLVRSVSGRAVIPQTFVIDNGGRIRKHFVGFSPTKTPKLLRAAVEEASRAAEPSNAPTFQ